MDQIERERKKKSIAVYRSIDFFSPHSFNVACECVYVLVMVVVVWWWLFNPCVYVRLREIVNLRYYYIDELLLL